MLPSLSFLESDGPHRGQQTVSVKGLSVNILGFTGHIQYLLHIVQLLFNNPFKIEKPSLTGGLPDLPLGFAKPCYKESIVRDTGTFARYQVVWVWASESDLKDFFWTVR